MQTTINIFRNDEIIKGYEKDVDHSKGGENVPKLEFVEVDLVR